MRIFLMIVQFAVCLVLIVSVLLQSSKSSGLSGTISGGAEQLFGKKKSKGYDEMLSKISTITAIVFMILSVILVMVK